MKTLIVMSALPGSGKSTWANDYANKHKNVFILSIDEIRFEVTNSYSDFSHQKKVWKIFNKRLRKLSKAIDATIIIDALNNTNEARLNYIKDYPNFDEYILVYMKKEKTQLEYFNRQRPKNRWVPEEALKKLYDRFEDLNDEVKKAYSKVIVIKNYS